VSGDLGAIALAERVLAVLDQGSFSATYKYALFMAILDLTIEKTTAGGPPTSLTTRELAEEIVELYWPHASPYEPVRRILRQGGGHADHQAEVLRAIARFRQEVAGAPEELQHRARLAQPKKYEQLVRFVEWKLIEMPIPRLQVMGGDEDRFLYEYSWDQLITRAPVSAYQDGTPGAFDNRLLLKPGVAEHLVRLNGVLRPIVQREWAVMVAWLNGLPEATLETFLFGADRIPLDSVRQPLRDLQSNRCFYCDGRIAGACEVDHFIPWARYPDNGLDNLVAAHDRCNNNKRDFLAAADHLERWRQRARDHGDLLADLAVRLRWERNSDRSRGVASALYGRLPAGARLWRAGSDFEVADPARLVRALSA
jgi:HNH endonuclease